MPFPDMDVPVVLTGAEWTALLGRMVGYKFSPSGEKIYKSATIKLHEQLQAASDANPSIDKTMNVVQMPVQK